MCEIKNNGATRSQSRTNNVALIDFLINPSLLMILMYCVVNLPVELLVILVPLDTVQFIIF